MGGGEEAMSNEQLLINYSSTLLSSQRSQYRKSETVAYSEQKKALAGDVVQCFTCGKP